MGLPGAGLQSFVAGSTVNVQFMVKDSKKYAATGGWGFADFTNGRPGIIRFLGALTDREKLLALAYLANDRMISARIPGLANTIMDMHRAHHRSALLKSVGAKSCNIDLELVARRKGCGYS